MWRPLPQWKSIFSRWKGRKAKKVRKDSLVAIDGDGGRSGSGGSSAVTEDQSTQRRQRRRRRRHKAENQKKIVWTSPRTYFTAVQAWYEALTSGDFLLDPEDQEDIQRRRPFPWSFRPSHCNDDVDDATREADEADDDDYDHEDDDDPYRAADRYLQASEAHAEASMLHKFFPADEPPDTARSVAPPITIDSPFPSSSLTEQEDDIDEEVEEGEEEVAGGQGKEPLFSAPSLPSEVDDTPSVTSTTTTTTTTILPPAMVVETEETP